MKKTRDELAKSKRLSEAVGRLNLGIDLANSLGEMVDTRNLGLDLMMLAGEVLETMASIRIEPLERSEKREG